MHVVLMKCRETYRETWATNTNKFKASEIKLICFLSRNTHNVQQKFGAY